MEKQRLRVLGGLERQFPGKCWFKLRNGLKHAVLARFRQENGRKTAILLLLRMVPNCELLTATMANAGTAGQAPCSLAWTGPEIRAVIEERGIELVSMRDLFDYSSCRPK